MDPNLLIENPGKVVFSARPVWTAEDLGGGDSGTGGAFDSLEPCQIFHWRGKDIVLKSDVGVGK